MPNVTGDVSTWGVTAFPADSRLLVRFVPSSAAVGPSELLPKRTEDVLPAADGTFTKNLIATTELIPDCWYTVRFEWFQKHPITGAWELDGWSDLPGRLRVPPGGGDVADLIDVNYPEVKRVPLYFGFGLPPEWLPPGGVYFDLDDPEGAGVYSDGPVV